THRMALIGATWADIRRQLSTSERGIHGVVAPGGPVRTAFFFPAWPATNNFSPADLVRLAEAQPAFNAALEECSTRFRLGSSIVEKLKTDAAQVLEAHPHDVTFAVEYAWSQLWRSWGIEPKAVMGTGVGELVAACCA